MKNKKLVLAYSGGLDTSYAVRYLSDKGYDVHAAMVDTGGFDEEDILEAKEKARIMGAASFRVLDVQQAYYDQCIRYLVYGNVLRNNTYPMSVSAERMIQALTLVKFAKDINAEAIAHGSTAAGNDQVRFDLVFSALAEGIEIITPIRDQNLSREEEMDYLIKHGIEMDWSKAKYSINKGLWGTSVGGAETLTSDQALPEEAYPSPLKKTEPRDLVLHFQKGELSGIDSHQYINKVEAIKQLQSIAQDYAIGRDIHVGDTIIGIKGRVGFEAAAPILIIKAHHLLEKHTLSKWQLHWKDQLANWYGMMIHEAKFLDPVMRDIEAYLESSQETVTGTVNVRLHPYRFELQGITSENDLMQSKAGQYGETNKAWDADDAKGFIKIYGNQDIIYHQLHKTKK
ncbi:argininosuccinate synthase [Membranicola marinus]|uniref:argininosuccinate synthase n=1 Tax=Membranihabitans marinus TaxID=1227546 RepID=A0A953LAM6_9BACT|nr:argininosuccinate synthase domain-containing protein [Membranihabitans marinus]MBY5960120.1 argininosuccinate synthase [Membranihabitans marinus]